MDSLKQGYRHLNGEQFGESLICALRSDQASCQHSVGCSWELQASTDLYVIPLSCGDGRLSPIQDALLTLASERHFGSTLSLLNVVSEQTEVPFPIKSLVLGLKRVGFAVKSDETYLDLQRFCSALKRLSDDYILPPYYAPSDIVEVNLQQLGLSLTWRPIG